MIKAWRLTPPQYLDSAFTGIGAKEAGGRWNKKGTPVVYASSSFALALLEILVNTQATFLLPEYAAIRFSFEPRQLNEVDVDSLPAEWHGVHYTSTTQELGEVWFQNAERMVLSVPSAVIPFERNYLVNPMHEDIENLKREDAISLLLDKRLRTPQ